MARKTDVEFSIGVRLDQLQKALTETGNLTEREAKRMTIAMQREINTYKKASAAAARESRKAWKKTSGSVRGALESMVPGFSQVSGAMDELGGVVSTVAPKLSGLAGPLAAIGAAGGAAAAGAYTLASASRDIVNEMELVSRSTGLALDTVTALDAALRAGGGSLDQAEGALTALTERASDAATEGGEAAEQFARLGIGVTDASGNLKDADTLLRDTLAALERLPSQTARAGAAMTLMGDEGARLLATLDPEKFREAGAATEGMISPEAQAAAEALDTAVADLQTTVKGLAVTIGTDATPRVVELAGALEGVATAGAAVGGWVIWFLNGLNNLNPTTQAYQWVVGQVAEAQRDAAEATEEHKEAAERAGRVYADVTGDETVLDWFREQNQESEKAGRNMSQLKSAIEGIAIEVDRWASADPEAFDLQREIDELKAMRTEAEAAGLDTTVLDERIRQLQMDIEAMKDAPSEAMQELRDRIAEVGEEVEEAGAEDPVLFAYDEELEALRELAKVAREMGLEVEAVERRIQQVQTERRDHIKQRDKEDREEAQREAEEEQQEKLDAIKQGASELEGVTAEATRLIDQLYSNMLDKKRDTIEELQTKLEEGEETLTDAEKAELEERIAAEKRGALRVFEAQQKMAIAQIGIDAITAGIKAYAQLGPIGGSIAAAGIGTSAALAIQEVKNQEPPSFHAGGAAADGGTPSSPGADPGEFYAKLRTPEVVVDPNEMSGGGALVVQQVYQHRAFGAFVQNDVRLPSSPLRKAVKGRSRVGHRRRRM